MKHKCWEHIKFKEKDDNRIIATCSICFDKFYFTIADFLDDKETNKDEEKFLEEVGKIGNKYCRNMNLEMQRYANEVFQLFKKNRRLKE